MQERCNSIANALELHLSCTNPSIYTPHGLPMRVRYSVTIVTSKNDLYSCLPGWCHQMETFSALLSICAGNSPVPGEFPAQRPVTQSFDVFFHLRPNKLLSKQLWGWWFETPSHPLWRHRNGNCCAVCNIMPLLAVLLQDLTVFSTPWLSLIYSGHLLGFL